MAEAVVGVVKALPGIWHAGEFIYKGLSGYDCKKLEQTVNNLLPTIKEICRSSSVSSSNLSLQHFLEFRDKIAEGNQLVDEYKRSRHNLPWRFIINERIKKLDKYISNFIQNDLQVYILHSQVYLSTQHEAARDLQVLMLNAQASLSTQLETVRQRVDIVLGAVQTVHQGVESGVETLSAAVETVHQEVKNLASKIDEQHTHFFGQQIEISQQDESLCETPDPPSSFLGFDEDIQKVKTLLLEDGVNVVGITAMGGAGKSTLAAAVCNDKDIKGRFEKVIYIVVSESPDHLCILKTIWKDIGGGQEPDFTSVEDAHNKLQRRISSKKKPTLVVLDDIWSKSDLENLLFEEEQYKTLVTTRDEDVIPQGPKTHIHYLPSLQPNYALSLFCHHAFSEPSIPSGRNKELVEKVQQECNGLPLALKVIGRSLYGKSDCVWEQAKKRLSAGEPFKDDHKNSVLNKLKTSIEVLDDNEKQCFMDLGAFPQRKTIPANALLDIWVYVRGMKSDEADMLLWKFAAHHLLDLKKDPGTPGIIDDCMNGYSFSQHDVMRDLALYLAKLDNNIQCRKEKNKKRFRLFMPKLENHFPSEWQTDRDLSSKAQIVSIHTGAIDTQWPEMKFPEVEALVLYFTASEYCIPTFLRTMKKLKVLIIHNNDRARRTKLSGLAGFQALSQLKTLHLERLIVPEDCKVLESLEKIYLSLCKGLGRDKTFNFPRLLEFNVDYCNDLEELPAGLCSSVSLKMLSVTHCHSLAKLPEELDKLGSLKEIRLCESLGLKALPSSICRLKNLKLLDISSCIHLKVKRGEGCELEKTLKNLAKLPSLKRVICDKENERLFRRSSGPELNVQAVEEQEPSLDWLDWEGKKLEF